MNVTRREVQTRRAEYVVPVPCHGKDLFDAQQWALNDLHDAGVMIHDDSISVSVTDDEIILSFPISAVTDEGGEAEAPSRDPFDNQPTIVYGDAMDRSTWEPGGNGWLILPPEMKEMKR